MQFIDLFTKTVPEPKRFQGVLLALDPGETTGWCVFQATKMLASGQVVCATVEQGTDQIEALINQHKPDFMVYEDYKVYAWKANSHSWNELHTPQLIGGIRHICHSRKIPVYKHMAQMPKGFMTDDKLHLWGYWVKGQKHARDSIRHALYFLLFTYPKVKA